jgi:hypothetical protein
MPCHAPTIKGDARIMGKKKGYTQNNSAGGAPNIGLIKTSLF